MSTIKKLITLANTLDQSGHQTVASFIDKLIKIATGTLTTETFTTFKKNTYPSINKIYGILKAKTPPNTSLIAQTKGILNLILSGAKELSTNQFLEPENQKTVLDNLNKINANMNLNTSNFYNILNIICNALENITSAVYREELLLKKPADVQNESDKGQAGFYKEIYEDYQKKMQKDPKNVEKLQTEWQQWQKDNPEIVQSYNKIYGKH